MENLLSEKKNNLINTISIGVDKYFLFFSYLNANNYLSSIPQNFQTPLLAFSRGNTDIFFFHQL